MFSKLFCLLKHMLFQVEQGVNEIRSYQVKRPDGRCSYLKLLMIDVCNISLQTGFLLVTHK